MDTFKELKVWNASVDLVTEVFGFISTEDFAKMKEHLTPIRKMLNKLMSSTAKG